MKLLKGFNTYHVYMTDQGQFVFTKLPLRVSLWNKFVRWIKG